MLVKGIMTQISGSLGGITGSHNSGGMYLRARTIPTDPGTFPQQLMRTIMAFLTSRWSNTLSAAQRSGWATYAENTPLLNPLGDSRNVGALPMYVRGNSVRAQIGQSAVDDAPLAGLPALSPPTNEALASGTGLLTADLSGVDAWEGEDDSWLAIYASRPLPASINFFKGPYRLLGSLEGDSVTPPSTFSVNYAAQFPTLASGDKVFIQYRVADASGRLSAAVRSSVIST